MGVVPVVGPISWTHALDEEQQVMPPSELHPLRCSFVPWFRRRRSTVASVAAESASAGPRCSSMRWPNQTLTGSAEAQRHALEKVEELQGEGTGCTFKFMSKSHVAGGFWLVSTFFCNFNFMSKSHVPLVLLGTSACVASAFVPESEYSLTAPTSLVLLMLSFHFHTLDR